MADQIITPLFLSPTGFTGGTVVRTSSVGVFQGVMLEDITNVFIPTENNDFAVTAIYTHKGESSSRTYSVIFDNPTINTDSGINSRITYNTQLPYFQIGTHLLPRDPAYGDEVIIAGVRYTVDNFDADGVGITTVYVKEF